MMRVAIDGAVFENRHQLGIWRVFYEVFSRLHDRVEATLWLGDQPVQPTPTGVGVCRDSSRIKAPRWNIAARLLRRVSRQFPPARVLECDIFHSSYFNVCPKVGPIEIVGVYDMIPERLFSICPDYVTADIARKRAALRRAHRCICISQATADDLAAFYPDLLDRIRVVPLGADHLASAPRKVGGGENARRDPYALFVGHRDSYKNFWVVPEAMRNGAWPRSLGLHVVGPPPNERETELLRTLGVADRVSFLGRLADDELAQEYRFATCFIFPSLLEGFGLPVLEAQINRCPAVLSDTSVFREVAGDGAFYFDPRAARSLAEAVASAFEPANAQDRVEKGMANARRYTWEATASKTLEVYMEALRTKGGKSGA